MQSIRCFIACCSFAVAGASAQAATIVQSFNPIVNFDDGPGSVAVTLAGLDPNVESDLTLDFTFFGDLNGLTETFELFLDGTSYGIGCDFNPASGDFGAGFDICSQATNSLTDATLLVSAVEAAGLLADGALEIAFNFSAAVNDFVDITNGGETRSGVFFGNTQNASFGAGGTITYDATDPIAPVPVPPALPMLAGGLLALGFMRRAGVTA